MVTIKSLSAADILAWGQAISILVQAGILLEGQIAGMIKSVYSTALTDQELNVICDGIIADALIQKALAQKEVDKVISEKA
jgi:hypothetical protein